ncbi:hypothetical protein O7632_22610 [Solwaraspora sp. WMMD406]|uniref:hypothetical protein n=1 Tax=Solwaraspora sp. WMMD406 TaxID=3016095 RepID=UPI0024177AC7|nr:hypothetical protein [Solwaraspora sp. WMMD406]MDG4766869.1 hypothetical protein [Solwaraspora sp. WMMD406]
MSPATEPSPVPGAPGAPGAPGDPDRRVRCPLCLDTVRWGDVGDELYSFADGAGYRPLVLPPTTSPEKRAGVLRTAHIRCPNQSGDTPRHYLPLLYSIYQQPIVVGFVGASLSGKTHLLAAMIGEIENGGLARYGLQAVALDLNRHRSFLNSHTRPLLERGDKLQGTREGVVDFADALLISSPAGTWPVTFFDIGGEDLGQLRDNTRFLNGVTALVFVLDSDIVTGRSGRTGGRPADETYRSVLSLLHPGAGLLDVPAAVVINKSDIHRFDPPVENWLRRPAPAGLDPERILAESRDAYAFLHRAGATALLEPYRTCRRCTLHFASATGGEARGSGYPGGVRPMRVLEPLVALLAMSGVLAEPAAQEVGR